MPQSAAHEGGSARDLRDSLAERVRRQQILKQHNTRMAEILGEPEESMSLPLPRHPGDTITWWQELAVSEASAADSMADEPAYFSS